MRHLQYIVFEAISNALQHARASELRLSAQSDADTITVRIQDDGVGRQDGASGNGLRTMQERATLVGALLTVCRGDAAGTTVQVVLPLLDASAEPSPPISPAP